MLRTIELENFRAFAEPVRIELAPITLIFGQNSAGKSSILQALSLLKQTRESREFGAPLLPRAEQGLVDLGSFQELIFNHELSRDVVIGVDVRTGTRLPGMPFVLARAGVELPESIGLKLRFRRPSPDSEVEVHGLETNWGGLGEPLAKFTGRALTSAEYRTALRGPWGPVRGRQATSRSKLRGAECTAVSRTNTLWLPCFNVWHNRRAEVVKRLQETRNELAHRQQSLFELDEAADPQAQAEIRRQLEQAVSFYSSDFSFEQFLDRMTQAAVGVLLPLDGFLPSGRSLSPPYLPELAAAEARAPHRNRGFPTVDVSWLTFWAGRVLEETLESLFPMGPFRRPPERWYIFTGTSPQDVGYRGDLLPDLLFRRGELVEAANEWLARLNMGYALTVKGVGGRASDLFEVRLIDQTRASPVDVALSDVGFGISQILPFVVQCLASERQIISIEQPEVHIHPKLQADLGELIATCIGEPYGHQFLIETHSEHLILRLQKLVREQRLKPDDISVIFVSRGTDGSHARRLRLDEEGDFIDEWPGGFFAERLRDLR